MSGMAYFGGMPIGVISALSLMASTRRPRPEPTPEQIAEANAARERAEWNRNAELKRSTKKAAKRALKAMGERNHNMRKG